jgi:predicted ribosomally synthesized peptide with SipW-like signal peptide
MKVNKHNLIVTLSILLIAVMTMGSTLAYFTDTDEKTNKFTMGDLDIDLTENWNPEDGEEMFPGDNVEKVPYVTEKKGDSYLRIVVTVLDKNDGVADGTTVKDQDRLDKIMSTLFYDPNYENSSTQTIKADTKYNSQQIASWGSKVQQTYNHTDFTLHSASNGVYVYYYTNSKTDPVNVLKEGVKTTLFSRVIIPSDWDQDDIHVLGKYNISVKAEAVQVEGFADQDAAFSALDDQIAATSQNE